MDKQALYDLVTHVEKQVGELYKELGNVKQYVVQLLEENHHLQMENFHLRSRLEDEVKQEPSSGYKNKPASNKKQVVGEGYDNLARLYHEGFHICNIHYGSIRREGDDCLFCLSFLNK